MAVSFGGSVGQGGTDKRKEYLTNLAGGKRKEPEPKSEPEEERTSSFTSSKADSKAEVKVASNEPKKEGFVDLDEYSLLRLRNLVSLLEFTRALREKPALIEGLKPFTLKENIGWYKDWFRENIDPIIEKSGVDAALRKIFADYGLLVVNSKGEFTHEFTASEYKKISLYFECFHDVFKNAVNKK